MLSSASSYTPLILLLLLYAIRLIIRLLYIVSLLSFTAAPPSPSSSSCFGSVCFLLLLYSFFPSFYSFLLPPHYPLAPTPPHYPQESRFLFLSFSKANFHHFKLPCNTTDLQAPGNPEEPCPSYAYGVVHSGGVVYVQNIQRIEGHRHKGRESE